MWVSGAIVREYSVDEIPENVFNLVWAFVEQLMASFINNYSTEIAPNVREHPDKLDDFFLMMQDVLLGYPFKLITSSQLGAVYEVAKSTLDLLKWTLSFLYAGFDGHVFIRFPVRTKLPNPHHS